MLQISDSELENDFKNHSCRLDSNNTLKPKYTYRERVQRPKPTPAIVTAQLLAKVKEKVIEGCALLRRCRKKCVPDPSNASVVKDMYAKCKSYLLVKLKDRRVFLGGILHQGNDHFTTGHPFLTPVCQMLRSVQWHSTHHLPATAK